MLAKQLHQLCCKGEQLKVVILLFTSVTAKWMDYLSLVKKRPKSHV